MACKERIDLIILCYDDVVDWANYFKTRLQEFNVKIQSLEEYSENLAHCDYTGFMFILSPMSDLHGHKVLPKLQTLTDVCTFGVVGCCGREPQPEDAVLKDLSKPEDRLTFRITEDRSVCSQYVREIRKRLVKHENEREPEGRPQHKTPPLPPKPKPKKKVDNDGSQPVQPKMYDVPPAPVKHKSSTSYVNDFGSTTRVTPTPPPRKTSAAAARTPDLPSTPEKPPTDEAVSIFPKEVRNGDDLMLLLKTDVTMDDMQVWLENRRTHHRERLYAARLQKHVFKMTFRDLDVPPGLIHAEVYNGKDFLGLTSFTYLSTTESLAKLVDKSFNALQLMTDSLGVDSGNRLSLDQCLAARLKSRTPSKLSVVFKLKKENSLEHVNSSTELPTLLHFSAFFGLPEVTRALLRLPGSERALGVQNENGLTPLELAHKAGFEEVFAIIEEFQRKTCEDDAIYLSLIGKGGDLATLLGKSPDLTATTINEEESTYEFVSFKRPARSVPASDVDLYDVMSSEWSRSNTLTSENARDDVDDSSGRTPLGARPSNDDLYMTMADGGDLYMEMNNTAGPTHLSGLPDLRDQRLSGIKDVLDKFHVDRNPLSEQYSTETLYAPLDLADGASDWQDPVQRDRPAARREKPASRPLPSVPDITSADFDSSGESASNMSSPRVSWNGPGEHKRPSLEEIMAFPEKSARDEDPRMRQQPSAMLELLEIQKDFKDGFSQQETLLRFEEWKRRYPETDKEEKKTFISVLRQRFGGGRRRKSSPGMKEAVPQTARPVEVLAQSTINISLGETTVRTTRPDSSISTTSTTSGTSSRSSGISIGPGTSDDLQEEYSTVAFHRRLNRAEPRQLEDEYPPQGQGRL